MATRSKTKTKEPKFRVRTVKSKEDRKRPSVFTRLKTEEYFRAYALFEPDPELDDNPGYYEYYDHYDKQANQYVPCAGDDCPFCRANDNPSTRALTVWYFPDNDEKEKLKVFTMNFSTINAASDEAEDEDGMLGRKVRIKRLSDKGDYRVKILSGADAKPLTKKEITSLLKEVEEMELPKIVERQLAAQIERLKAMDALEDDDEDEEDDDEEETPRTRSKSKRRGKEIEEDDDEDEDEDEDEEDEDEDDEDEDEEEDEDEDEEDEDDDEEEDDEDDDEEEEESSEISGESYEIVKTNESEETLDLKGSDGKKVKMFVGEGVDVDYDEFAKGTMVTLDAQQDDEGDWVITKIGKKRGRKPSTKK